MADMKRFTSSVDAFAREEELVDLLEQVWNRHYYGVVDINGTEVPVALLPVKNVVSLLLGLAESLVIVRELDENPGERGEFVRPKRVYDFHESLPDYFVYVKA